MSSFCLGQEWGTYVGREVLFRHRGIQLDLQRKILTAMRNLGMAPVLPGFAGFVPDGLKRVYPQAKLSRVSRWGGFNNTYCCTYHLHSTDPLFKVLVSYSAIRALPVKNSC